MPNMQSTEPILDKYDEPSEIIESSIEARKRLLYGFGGQDCVDKKKFKESLAPTMLTMSLTGEPTLYPKISEIVEEGEKRDMISFLVTNGSMPKAIETMRKLPWQLYVTLPSPNKETFIKTCRPKSPESWENIIKTLEIFPSLDCRKVVRVTLTKGLNMKSPEKYAQLIKKTECNFIELKSYSWVGFSRKRLDETNVPTMDDMRAFAKAIAEKTGYEIADEDEPSKVLMLKPA